MKTLRICFLLTCLFFISSTTLSAQNCSLVLNGRSGNADLFEVTGNYQYITVSPKFPLYYIRIDYSIGNNSYSEVIPLGQPYYLGAIKSFTLSAYYSAPGSNYYETEMYIISCN
jgi:hypothetical protein